MSLSIVGQNADLRVRLVIENETMSRHADQLRDLKQEFQHSIRCVARPVDGTCVTYALDLLPSARELVAALQDLGVKPGSDFVNWLLETDRLVEIEELQPGALVLYFAEGEWKHVAIAGDDGRLTSKWGSHAIFDHGLTEVPADYGGEVRYVTRLSAKEAAEHFFAYGREVLELTETEATRLSTAAGL